MSEYRETATPADLDAGPHKWLTWNKAAIIAGVALVAGLLLVLLHPVWLAPPNFRLTPVFYGLLVIAWVPVLFVLSLFHPAGNGMVGRWMLLGGMAASVFWLVLFAPDVGGFLFLGQTQCQSIPAPGDGVVRYLCSNDFMQGHADYLLEGPDGSPFVWVLDAQAAGFD